METDKDAEPFFLVLIMLITTGIINDHIYLIVSFRLTQFDFKVGQFRSGPFTKLSDIYFQNKKLSSSTQWIGYCLTSNQFHDRAKLLCYAFHSLSPATSPLSLTSQLASQF